VLLVDGRERSRGEQEPDQAPLTSLSRTSRAWPCLGPQRAIRCRAGGRPAPLANVAPSTTGVLISTSIFHLERPGSRITIWSLGRFQGFRFCAQEIECSPQRRIALGVSQHGTDSLTLRVAEDFQSGRFVLG